MSYPDWESVDDERADWLDADDERAVHVREFP